jgi:hypothetical protein
LRKNLSRQKVAEERRSAQHSQKTVRTTKECCSSGANGSHHDRLFQRMMNRRQILSFLAFWQILGRF